MYLWCDSCSGTCAEQAIHWPKAICSSGWHYRGRTNILYGPLPVQANSDRSLACQKRICCFSFPVQRNPSPFSFTLYKVGFVLTGNFLYYTGEDQHKPEKKISNWSEYQLLFCLSGSQCERETDREWETETQSVCVWACGRACVRARVCVCPCVCVCILDGKGSRVFACRPLIVV